MWFAVPIWLLGLLPWSAMTVWLLWGRRQRTAVPFLRLWQGEPTRRLRRRRALEVPPLGLAAMLTAVLLTILAAARPTIGRREGGSVTVLVDRGVTMSAISANGEPRYVEAARTLDRELRERWAGAARVQVVDVVGGETRQEDVDGWVSAVAALPRTAVDTRDTVGPAVAAELAQRPGAVILLSDHRASSDDRRFGQVRPNTAVRNVGIVAMSAREAPLPQVMVALRNDSTLTSAELRVRTAAQQVTRPLVLPPAGEEERFFIDVPKIGDVLEVALGVAAGDALDADNAAWLVRTLPPRIEVRGPAVADAVRRMVDVYNHARPGDVEAGTIAVVSRPGDLLAGDAGVVVEPLAQTAAGGELRVATHPVTALVDWGAAVKDAMAAPPPQGEGWTPLVTVGRRALVAARASPARQVWVGLDAPPWPRSADFVVFWTNALDWVRGDREASFKGEAVRLLTGAKRMGDAPSAANVDVRAWPGVYELPGGQRVATNAMGVRFGQGAASLDAGRALALAGGAQRQLSPWVLLAAIGCALVASLSWRETGDRAPAGAASSIA